MALPCCRQHTGLTKRTVGAHNARRFGRQPTRTSLCARRAPSRTGGACSATAKWPPGRLLARLRRQRPQEWILGGDSEFWLIEGLACYFESFRVEDGAITVGRPDHIRIVAARTRLLRDNFYMPLETFCRLGKDDFQHHANVKQLYSQASGVAHFLMHYDDGRYRDDLVRLLTSMYRPDARNLQRRPNLSTITGVPFATLDQQYREHMSQ